MSHNKWFVLMGTVFVLGCVVPVLAAGPDMTSNSDNPSQSGSRTDHQMMAAGQATDHANLQKADKLIGMKVQNTKGEELGTIRDIVLTPDRMTVAYAVLGHGGALGMGEKLAAIPWSALEFSTIGKNAVLDASKSDIDQDPGFDKNHWPDQGDMKWSHQSGMGGTSGYVPPGAADQAQNPSDSMNKGSDWKGGQTSAADSQQFKFRKATQLVGLDVKNSKNESLGTIEDVIIDTQNHQGHVVYGIVAYGGVLGLGEKYVAVPWMVLNIQPSANLARLDSTKSDLDAVAYSSDKMPDLADRNYARTISDHFNTQPYWETYGYMGAAGAAINPFDAWRAGSDYNKKFDTKNMTSISGTVESVGTFVPSRGAGEGIRLRVKTDDGKSMTVQVGPKFYLEKQNVSFQNGDMVKIDGCKTDFDGRTVILATTVTRGDQSYQMRDSQGNPQWESALPAKTQSGAGSTD